MLTVQQFLYQFSSAIEDQQFHLARLLMMFVMETFSFEEIPKDRCPVVRKGSKEDVVKIRHWATTYVDACPKETPCLI